MKKVIKLRINFSGAEFGEPGNTKGLPTFEEVSEEVIATVEDGKIIESTHQLSRVDEILILSKYEEVN